MLRKTKFFKEILDSSLNVLCDALNIIEKAY